LKKLFLLLLVPVAALILWGFLKKSADPKVPFAKAARATITSTISTNGKVEPIEYADVRVEVAGLVNRLLVHQGDTVSKGQEMAELSQPGVAQELEAAEARAAQARADLETLQAGGRGSAIAELEGARNRLNAQRASAQHNLESLQHLLALKAATPYDVEQAAQVVNDIDVQMRALDQRRAALVGKGDVEAAQARLREAEANVSLAKSHIAENTIHSPLAGVVYDLPARAGAYLNPGDPIGSVGKLDPVRVRVYVDEPELGRVAQGEKVRITWDALPGREWTGVVEKRPTEVVPLGSRQVGEVLCTIGNPNRDLVPGTNVNAFILTNVVTDALTILKTALRHENGLGVYLLRQDNTIHWQTVTTGVSDAFRVEALTGVHEGDAVAVSSEQPLKDGMKVDPVNQ